LQGALKSVTHKETRLRPALVRICFPDEKTQRLFNDYGLLSSRFGNHVARKIAIRMALLKAARHLGMIDDRPPVRLTRVDNSIDQFTVDLVPPKKLRFAAHNTSPIDAPEELSRVEEIEIIGIE
jgi:hypothetical protein